MLAQCYRLLPLSVSWGADDQDLSPPPETPRHLQRVYVLQEKICSENSEDQSVCTESNGRHRWYNSSLPRAAYLEGFILWNKFCQSVTNNSCYTTREYAVLEFVCELQFSENLCKIMPLPLNHPFVMSQRVTDTMTSWVPQPHLLNW